ncbi:MAG: class I SAM-dependent methyltransferase [Deltaproteobacteria bacterium]|nr:class I SAM-dependent methyltransferase [Deltaproteobacteria bacterium]
MLISRFVRWSALNLCVLMIASLAFAQPQGAQQDYMPEVGQAGKDVVWVPTSQALVDVMLDLAKVTPQDYVIDLGSGDGRLVITAAKRGARALGIEYNPDMVELSKRNAVKEGVADRAQVMKADIFESNFSQATVITMFLLPELNLKLRPQILNLKPGTRIVSNTFTMGDWEADRTATVDEGEKCSQYCTGHLWIVPAKVQGTWKLAKGDLVLKQKYQMVSGTLKGSDQLEIRYGRLSGDQITFTAGNTKYTGRVEGDSMAGTFNAQGSTGTWTATRIITAGGK